MASNPYETKRYVDEYLLFHYGRSKELCPYGFVPSELLQFHKRLREQCLLPLQSRSAIRALDIGCAVGRLTFELALLFDEVRGIDNSQAFINTARQLAKKRSATIRVLESGGHFSNNRIFLPKAFRGDRVRFAVGDALDLGANTFTNATFDLVTGINLLCRLPSPRKFLQQLPKIVKPGGQLILGSPFSWLENFTAKKEWLGAEEVIKALRPHFKLAQRRDLPFMIREHRRKFQLVVSDVMTFRRA